MPDVLSLGRAISLWEGSLRASRKAPKTIRGYVRACEYLEESLGRDYDPATIRIEDLEAVAGKWRDLSPTTVHNRMVAWREFFAWGGRRYQWPDPTRNLPLPRKDAPALRRLSESEVDAMLAASEGRDHVALAIFSMLGLRLSEVIALTWADVDLDGAELRIDHRTAKGRKGRTVPIPHALVMILIRAKLTREAHRPGAAAPACFVVYRRKPGGPDLMTRDEIEQYERACKDKTIHALVKRAARAAGIRDPESVTSHMFRRYLLERLLERGVSPYVAAALAGHASIETTAKYGGGASLKAVREALGDNPLCDTETGSLERLDTRVLSTESMEPMGIEPMSAPDPADDTTGSKKGASEDPKTGGTL